MDLTALKQFIDLGGIFILAILLLNQWGSRFSHIEDKLTRMIALLVLAISNEVPARKIQEILSEKELEIVNKIK